MGGGGPGDDGVSVGGGCCHQHVVRMEAVVFLQALDWLVPQQANASCKQFQPSPCATGPASSCLSCKTRFHICLSEQHTPIESIPAGGVWRGPFAQGAVQLRLRLPDGSCKSTLDATVTAQLVPQDQGDKASGLGQAVVVITWFGQDYQIKVPQHLVKVCCGLKQCCDLLCDCKMIPAALDVHLRVNHSVPCLSQQACVAVECPLWSSLYCSSCIIITALLCWRKAACHLLCLHRWSAQRVCTRLQLLCPKITRTPACWHL